MEYSCLWVYKIVTKRKKYSDSVICQVFRDQCKCGFYMPAILTWAVSVGMVQHTAGKILKHGYLEKQTTDYKIQFFFLFQSYFNVG